MAATSSNPTFSTFSPPSSTAKPLKQHFSTLPFPQNPHSTLRYRPLHISSSLSPPPPKPPSAVKTAAPALTASEHFVSKFAPDEPRKGADVLVEALEREGVTNVFAYPGGASLEIHQALTRCSKIRNVLPRHEQGGVFAAEGYARATGRVGVCIATSGPGATNLETPIVEVTCSITKHNYLVLDVEDIARIVKEAFYLANSGRLGPVLIDVPKDVQQQLVMPNWNSPNHEHLEQIVRELSLHMLGKHGTVYANYVVDKADLLLAFGVRFDDRVTGKLEAFASRAKIVHIDIDSAEIGKNKQPHVSICADIKVALHGLNKVLEKRVEKMSFDFSEWRDELLEIAIPPQYAIRLLDELTGVNAIVSTGVGQHQMWAAQHYKYNNPRQWLSSSGLGAMGFGLPAAMGAAVGRPELVVVDIDGDGSFIMNVQELATIKVQNLPVKIMILNNQHLGMVVQWEDRFYKANRAHTYLGNPSKTETIFPDMLKFAEACDIPAARVTKVADLRAAIQKMLDTPGPYLLDVIVPHQEHVLPMIPSGGAFKDTINEGDGRTKY
ncbi:hypothetical protein RND81_04G137800 [Saponaria officinalis]|uniref:Acetolactate synthase n=1 Tax=Saponaria officinalis TaxID=3572 RepID=A0AAW1LKF7_SAPOF